MSPPIRSMGINVRAYVCALRRASDHLAVYSSFARVLLIVMLPLQHLNS